MIQEDHVSFETAKLLKEKGLGVPSFNYKDWLFCMYDENGEVNYGYFSEDWYPRITLQMAMKWLREVHKIFIDVDWSFKDYYFILITNMEKKDYIKTNISGNEYNSYEEAVEVAIKYCLKNLI